MIGIAGATYCAEYGAPGLGLNITPKVVAKRLGVTSTSPSRKAIDTSPSRKAEE